MTERILIEGGRVVDPARAVDGRLDVLIEAGHRRAVGFSDDGAPVANAEVMRRALLYAQMFDKVVIEHAEDPHLAGRGVMHAGLVSMVLGLPGKSSASEEVMVARDIALVEVTGGRL